MGAIFVRPVIFNAHIINELNTGHITQFRLPIKPKYDNTHIDQFNKYGRDSMVVMPPYKKGDILYLKESFKNVSISVDYYESGEVFSTEDGSGIKYASDDLIIWKDGIYPIDDEFHLTTITEPEKWQSATQMPYSAARTFLKIKNVSFQKLQDITEADAVASGAAKYPKPSDRHKGWNDRWIKGYCSDCEHFDIKTGLQTCIYKCDGQKPTFRASYGCTSNFALRADDAYEPARFRYSYLWDENHQPWNTKEKGCYWWENNPWVWVITFELCAKPV